MARTRRQFSNRVGPKRLTDWAFGVIGASYVSVPPSSKVVLASFSGANLSDISPGTIVRTRGMFSIASDQISATETQIGAFGIALVNDVARALGVTGIPGPATDTLWDGWFVHRFFAQRMQFASSSGFDGRGATEYEVDSKAMRKFESDQGLVVVLENNHATNGLFVATNLRFLVKAG